MRRIRIGGFVVWTDLALGKEKFDTHAAARVCDGVILALLIVAHGVEAVGWRRGARRGVMGTGWG